MKLRLIQLVLVFCLLQETSAYAISDINLTISNDGFVRVGEEILVYVNETPSGIALHLPAEIEDLSVTAPTGIIPHSIEYSGEFLLVSFNISNSTFKPKDRSLLVSYGSRYLTVKSGGTWFVSFYSNTTPRQTIVRLNFPKDSKILSILPAVVLRSYDKDSVWLYPQEDYFSFNSSYEYSSDVASTLVTSTTIVNVDGGRIYPYSIIVLVLVVILFLVVLGFKTRLSRQDVDEGAMGIKVEMPDVSVEDVDSSSDLNAEKVSGDAVRRVKSSMLKMFEDNELAVVGLLEKSREDEVTQAYIYKTTRIPKATLSKLIRGLERRNIIERRRAGRVNWIKLKKWVLE